MAPNEPQDSVLDMDTQNRDSNNQENPENSSDGIDPNQATHAEFHKAIYDQDYKRLKELIRQGGHNLNAATDEEHVSPLFTLVREALYRAEPDDLRIIRMLAQHGADVNHRNVVGDTPLHMAAANDSETGIELVRLLLQLGADPNIGRVWPEDQPQQCQCGGHVGAQLEAIEANAGIGKGTAEEPLSQRKKRYREDSTPLHVACGHGNLAAVRILIENGAKVDVMDEREGIPLHQAVSSGNVEVCKLLLESGPPSQLQGGQYRGHSPLHQAAAGLHPDIVRLLLEKGADLEAVVEGENARSNEIGLTPLMMVCHEARGHQDKDHEKRAEMAQILLDAGANPNIVGSNLKQTALALAIANGNLPTALVLVSGGADIAALQKSDTQPLLIAATKGHADICHWLVTQVGCDVNTRTTDGEKYTAIINAAGYGNAQTVGILIDLGADKEAAIYDGRRASHFAAFKGKADCMQELINRGANIEAKDDNDWSPLHFAARYHHPEVVRILLDNGAKIGERVTGGPHWRRKDETREEVEDFTAAELAKTRRGGGECVDILVKAGDELRAELGDLTDEDLLEEKEGCVVM